MSEAAPAKPEKHSDTCAGHEGLRYCDCGVEQRKYPSHYAQGGPEPDWVKVQKDWRVREADASPAKDPIADAVDAQLDPLKDELVDIGHKLAKETR